MARRSVHLKRGQREWRALPQDEIVVPKYPQEGMPPSKLSIWVVVAPMGGVLVMAVGIGIVSRNLIYPAIMAVASLIYPMVTVLRHRDQQRQWETKRDQVREAFTRRIAEIESELSSRERQQRDYLNWASPSAKELVQWAERLSPRLWERRPADPDFLHLRIGLGDIAASYRVVTPESEIPELAPPEMIRAQEMALGHTVLRDVPLAFALRENGSLAIVGHPKARKGLSRSLLVEACSLHAPSDLEIYSIFPAHETAEWEWLKWMPHTYAIQSGGSRNHLAYEPIAVRHVLSSLLDELHARSIRRVGASASAEPHLLVFVADHEAVRGEIALRKVLESGKNLSVSLILLAQGPRDVPAECAAYLEVQEGGKARLHLRGEAEAKVFEPDQVSIDLAEKTARLLAPIRLTEAQVAGDLPEEIRLMELLGSPHLDSLDLQARWTKALSVPPKIRTVLGMRQGNRPLVVDLKQSGHGPHGLIAGTTGSGKSELLLSILTGLAIDHHPHQVNFVLVDYKGGTAMSALADLPHTVGVVTDLDGRQTRRALNALRSEMARREEILARHKVADIDKYHELGIQEPFPYLFIVIDEFAELKEHFKNDLADVLKEFVSIAQKGRALGVHLLLAMQKPQGVVNDSIRANMKYRVCLRVERAEDSRNVLGRPDAYLLPNRPPGRAYFQVGNDEQFDLFQVARIAGLHRGQGAGSGIRPELLIQEVASDGRRIPLLQEFEEPDAKGDEPTEVRTEAQVLVEKAVLAAKELGITKLPSPWPPPLPAQVSLEELFAAGDLQAWDGQGWPDAGPERRALHAVPLGMLDEPSRQRQEPLLLSPAREGNLLIVGATGSGRTLTLLSLASSMARAHPPSLVHFHLIDFAGHQMRAALTGFPHVAGVYSSGDGELIRRLNHTLANELERRRGLFAEKGVAGIEGYWRADEAEPLPAILIMINNLTGFQEALGDEVTGWLRLLREGNAYGLFFAITSDRLPPSRLADLCPARLALRIVDTTAYSILLGSRPDLTTYDPLPGRGFFGSKPPLEVQVALPVAGAPGEQITRLQELGRSMSRSWEGPLPGRIQLLGDLVTMLDIFPEGVPLDRGAKAERATPLGLDDAELRSVELSLGRIGEYFLVSGPPESGKTTALSTIALSFAASLSTRNLRLGIVAPNRAERNSLQPLSGLPHALGYANSAKSFELLLSLLDQEMQARAELDPPSMAALPQILILVDDYHLLGSRMPSALVGRLGQIGQAATDRGLTMILSVPTSALRNPADPILRQAKASRQGLWLRSTDTLEAGEFGVRIPPDWRRRQPPPGRGVLYDPGSQTVIQVAKAQELIVGEEPASESRGLTTWVAQIRAREEPDRR